MSKSTQATRIPVKSTGSTSLSLNLKCSDCIHFDGVAHAELKKPCKELGIKPYSRSCEKMNPNVARMSRSLGAMETLADVLDGMDESEIRLFAYAALKSKDLKKYTKFKYGEKVYFNLSAPFSDCIDSYFSGVVIGYIAGDQNSENGYLHIAGSLTSEQGSSITLPISSVLNERQWNMKYIKLLNMNQFYTPDSKRLRVECSEPTNPDEDYAVPTLDSSVSEVADMVKASKKGRGSQRYNKSALDTFKASSYNEEYDGADDEAIEEAASEGERKGVKRKKGKSGTTVFSYESKTGN